MHQHYLVSREGDQRFVSLNQSVFQGHFMASYFISCFESMSITPFCVHKHFLGNVILVLGHPNFKAPCGPPGKHEIWLQPGIGERLEWILSQHPRNHTRLRDRMSLQFLRSYVKLEQVVTTVLLFLCHCTKALRCFNSKRSALYEVEIKNRKARWDRFSQYHV